MKTGGYSLFEMLFVLAIAATAVGVSVPFIIQYGEKSRFESSVEKVVSQIRRAKLLAINKGKIYAVCIPLGEANEGEMWKFITIESTGRECGTQKGQVIVESVISYKVFQKSGKNEIKKIFFHPLGTSTNKSFCIENGKGSRWNKITVSSFARITTAYGIENPCG